MSNQTPSQNLVSDWLGNSEMAQRIRSFDWSTTSFGSLEAFPQSLQSALSIMLSSKAYMAIFWGTELNKFYNDHYATLIGEKHPSVLGQPAHIAWHEIWDVLEPLLHRVVDTREGVYAEDHLFVIGRHGYAEEAYFDISYDPICDESGRVGGVFCIVKETTRRVVGDRRIQTLRELSIQTVMAKTADAACAAAANVLNSNTADLPFSMLYRLNVERKIGGNVEGKVEERAEERVEGKVEERAEERAEGKVEGKVEGKACLISTTGIQTPEEITLEISQAGAKTPLQTAIAQVLQTGKPEVIQDLSSQWSFSLPDCVLGGTVAKPNAAIVLPLSRSEGQPPIGFLVAGISPFLTFGSLYQDFIELVAASITTGITNASAYEEERQRAEALAQLDRAKTSFFSNVSHEFRTPLTLMLSPLEQTLSEFSELLPDKAKSQLELVQRNGTRLLKLVNTLLDFSRIEARRTQAHYQPTDLATYTIELTSLFQSVFEQAGLQLRLDCSPLPEPIYVDREMWEKIVLNLLSNAFKFTFAGEIAVSLHPIGDRVELSVCDTGTGIPSAEIPKLFDRFHRVEGARGRTFEGTGIGLSLVQELVHLQGGTISVESTVGQGSTFRVRLPMGTAHLMNSLSDVRSFSDNSNSFEDSSPIVAYAKPYVQEATSWIENQLGGFSGRQSGELLRERSEERYEKSSEKLSEELSGKVPEYLSEHSEAQFRESFVSVSDEEFKQQFEKQSEGQSEEKSEEKPEKQSDNQSDERSKKQFSKQSNKRFNRQSDRHSDRQFGRQSENSTAIGSSGKPKLQSLTPARILIIDDNADMRSYLSRILSQSYEVETVADGRTALTAIHSRPPDLVLSDVMMPGMNGFELLKQLRGNPQTRNLPILLLSARAGEESSVEGLEAGADDYLVKPFSVRELLARVAANVELGRSRQITARRRLDAIVSSVPDFIYTLDLAGRFTYVNQPLLNFWQKSYAEVVGKTCFELNYPAGLAERVYQQIQQVITTQQPLKAETSYTGACGTRDYEYILVPLLDSEGAVEGVAGTSRDITDRKRTEAQRDALLAQAQTARETAEQANRIKDEFLAVLSHELRTPLNPILGWSRLLKQGSLDTHKTAEALETIERNARLQSKLIEDLLDISRILQGKLALTVAPVALIPTIEASLETVRLAAEAKQIEIQTVFDIENDRVNGDAGRLQQVVWNLLSNAVKFTPERGRVEVRLTQVGDAACLQVMDTGKGIRPEFLPYVFEHFRQEDGATTRKFGGLGLGLAIVRQLVELHGGTVNAQSAGEDRGATFTVTLPLLKPMVDRVNWGNPAAISESPAPLDGLKILVVDDEPDSREFVTFVLEEAGANVVAFSAASEVIQTIEQMQPDLLISDIGMPEMDGYMLMQYIRSQISAPVGQVYAIALTAYAGEVNERQVLKAGFQKHLTKPVDPADLVAAVSQLVSHLLPSIAI